MLKEKYTFDELVEIMQILRGENGCPWDREQNHESIKKYLIEEAYEVLDVINSPDRARLCEELGDVLLQIVFHAQISKDCGSFDINDVITGICRKMVLRHTHVFGDAKADTASEVLDNWEEIKKKEKGLENHTQALKDIPRCMPALLRSYKIQQKAARVGFDWENVDDAFKKIYEEIEELNNVYKSKNMERITDETGDLLFAVVNVARFLDVHPELALEGTIKKFVDRFSYIERKAAENGKKMEEMTLNEMDCLWNEAKTHNFEKKDKNYI